LKILEDINWSNGFYRKDIGHKVINEWESYLENLRAKKLVLQKIKIQDH
jgi:hypothetical protein